jgi:hypothetical protein
MQALAEASGDPQTRAVYLELSAMWLRLAEEASQRTSLPSPRAEGEDRDTHSS